MAIYNLGRVVPIYRGAYNPQTKYDELDIVLYGGSSFVALAEVQGVTPAENSPSWGLIAKRGERQEITQAEIESLENIVYQEMVDRGAIFDSSYNHSDNNYTTAEKNKLASIANGAEANVQSDWAEENIYSDSYIKNKPAIIQDADYVHTDNNFTTQLKLKLDGITEGAEANIQSDWEQNSPDSDAYIKNKPTIPTRTSQLENDSDFVRDREYIHTDNNFSNSYKSLLDNSIPFTDEMYAKLVSINEGAEKNVQPDWTETNQSADSYIRHKPQGLVIDYNYVHTDNNFTNNYKSKINSITNPDWNEEDTTSLAYIANKPDVVTRTGETTINDVQTYTIDGIQTNHIYYIDYGTSSSGLTNLTIRGDIGPEASFIYIKTGSTFSLHYPSDWANMGLLSFDPNCMYMIGCCNNVITAAQIERRR